MCIEDIRIGNNVYAKVTAVGSGATVSINGNGSRIGIRLLTLANTSNTGAFAACFVLGKSTLESVMWTNASRIADELSLQNHGNLVKGQFTFTTSGAAASVTEFLLDDQMCAPNQQPCPPTSLPGKEFDRLR